MACSNAGCIFIGQKDRKKTYNNTHITSIFSLTTRLSQNAKQLKRFVQNIVSNYGTTCGSRRSLQAYFAISRLRQTRSNITTSISLMVRCIYFKKFLQVFSDIGCYSQSVDQTIEQIKKFTFVDAQTPKTRSTKCHIRCRCFFCFFLKMPKTM